MSPPRASAPVHLGDTSFRRKDIIAQSQAVMTSLIRFFDDGTGWDNNRQDAFYGQLRAEAPEIFHGSPVPDAATRAQRARTYTNPLVKLGFVEDKRRPTELGRMFATSNTAALDAFDRICALTPENSAVLRGLLSYAVRTRSPDSSGTRGHSAVFFPVILLLQVLNRVGPLSRDEFALAFIIGPELIGIDAAALSEVVTTMRSSRLELEDFLASYEGEYTPAEVDYILSGQVTAATFPNRKTAQSSARYVDFVKALNDFRDDPTDITLATLRDQVQAGGGVLKDRFAPREYLPLLSKKGVTPLQIHEAAEYPGFHAASSTAFRHGLIGVGRRLRARKLASEYLDNNLRLLTATGVFSVAQNQVQIGSAYASIFFAENDDLLHVLAPAAPAPADRAAGLVARFGTGSLTHADIAVSSQYNVSPERVQAVIDEVEQRRFDAVVSETFPPDQVREHLRLIGVDHQSLGVLALRESAFGGKATVPCIYEYLIGLSLYYSSGRRFNPRSAFGLSLDGDFLPISHAPGLRGDIEFELDGRRILVEATLMDPATQRRGELEPVLRHATNLSCEYPTEQVLTLFIANEVDPNVARVFGFARLMAMTPTDPTLRTAEVTTARPLIVSLRTRDWIEIADAPLSRTLNLVAAEADQHDVDHLNSDWNSALVERLKGHPADSAAPTAAENSQHLE